jgi:hypothetical protein
MNLRSKLSYSIFFIVLSILNLFIFCALPSDPATDPENIQISITTKSDTVLVNTSVVFELALTFYPIIDSVQINFLDNTTETIVPKDSVVKVTHSFATENHISIIATAYSGKVKKVAPLTITIIKPVTFINKLISISAEPALSAPLTLSVNATGGGSINYKWYKNNQILLNSNTGVFYIQSVSNNDTGSYFCIIENALSKDTSNSYTLTFSPSVPSTILDNKETKSTGTVVSQFKPHRITSLFSN